jgi:thiol-disulfide isomerase/thioredoxin
LNHNEDAIKQFEAAFEFKQLDEYNPDDVEDYMKCLAENKKYDVVMVLLEKAFKTGKYTQTMRTLLKDVYIKQNGADTGFEKYQAEIDIASKSNMINELKQKMFNKPAYQFSLKDFQGKTIHLNDLKGKIVILDLWATWCGFCIASFPSMKTAVDRYASDKEVIFLFVDTMEKGDNKTENAKKFIDDNKYPFYVLLDNENDLSKNFNVTVIPTKLFIDKGGNWRFTSVGYDKDKILEEIDAMIEILQ